jgi:twitching motility protein PilJ
MISCLILISLLKLLGLQTDLLSEQGPETVNWVKSDDMTTTSVSAGTDKTLKPTVEGKQSYLSWFINAPLKI